MSKIAIVGSGGHVRSSTNLLLKYFDNDDMFIYDDSFIEGKQEMVNLIPLMGNINDIKLDRSVFLSIGDNNLRKKYFLRFQNQIIRKNLFHDSSLQEKGVIFGVSNQVYAHSYINSQVKIGDNNIINTGVIIEHESIIGDHNHLSIGVKICGRSAIGNMCTIGAGAVILDQLSICDNVIIGAGSVVIRDVKNAGTYVGSPLKRIK